LQHIAGGPRGERLADVGRVVLHRQHEDAGVGRLDPDLGGGIDAARPGHDDVEQHDVGLELARHPHGLLPIARLADCLEVVLALEEESEARPYDSVIVDDQDPDHAGTSTTSVVPWSGSDSTRSDPPKSSARSRIETRPRPSAGAPASKPSPLSSMTMTIRSPSRLVTTLTVDAPACFAMLVKASCTIRYSAYSTGSGRRGSSPARWESTVRPVRRLYVSMSRSSAGASPKSSRAFGRSSTA